jgi:NTE family protein
LKNIAAQFVALSLLVSANSAVAAPNEATPSAVTTINNDSAGAGAIESQKRPNTRPKVGLALGGGGTRGVAHVSVLRVLEKEGIPIDFIAGTSMGAIVGGLYAAGRTPDEIELMFKNKSMLHSYDTVPIPVRVALIPVFYVPHLLGHHPYDGLYRGNKFARFIENQVPPERRKLENLKIPFVAVASNLLDGKAYAISTGNIGKAIQSSSAIPALRRPVEWQGKLFVDGGVVDNLPVAQCRAMGADIVIAVNVDESIAPVPTKDFRKIGSVGFRCLNMNLATMDKPQSENADVVIHPDVDGIALLSRKDKDIQKALDSGIKAATDALAAIRAEINKKSIQTAER